MSTLSTYRGSEFLASGISHDLMRFVKKVSEAKSKAEERDHIHSELEYIKSRIGLPDVSSSKVKEYLIRLIHCHMMGYNVDFGLIYAIMITQSGESIADRRVGYLASTLFIENDSELAIMLTNTLQRDLQSAKFQDRCAALVAIGNIRQQEIVKAVVDLVIINTDYQKEIVRKKAYVALYWQLEIDPQLQDQLLPILEKGLVDKDPSVLGAVIGIWRNLIKKTPALYEEALPAIINHLRYILGGKLHKSFDYHGTPSPWVQMHCIEILEIVQSAGLGSPSEIVEVVMETLRAAEKGVDASFAIIYQCVRVLSQIPSHYISDLIDEGKEPFRAVQRFVAAQNHILKYLGLRCLSLMDDEFWNEEWRNGKIISEAIAISNGDDTLVDEAMHLIERIATSEVIYNIQENCLIAMSSSALQGTPFHTKLCGWYAKQIEDHCTDADWYLELMLQVIIESGKSLPDKYVDDYCARFGSGNRSTMI
ncbi:armadillo-type protein [Umbelopsis sp. AD052]|nr:armadillo-type protein [Umbelopsis sp. AD052]